MFINSIKEINRLHYLSIYLNSILEINNLCNVITTKLTFSAKRKLIFQLIEKFKHVQTFQLIKSKNV